MACAISRGSKTFFLGCEGFAFEPRVIEDVGDQRQQVFAARAYGAQIFSLSLAAHGLRQNLRHAHDAVQRRAQFMRQRGEQDGF